MSALSVILKGLKKRLIELNIEKKIFTKVTKSKLTYVVFKIKFYLEMGISQISFFTGKLPEIMSFIYLSEFIGIKLSPSQAGVTVFLIFLVIILLGYFMKHSGLFDVETLVVAHKNPVTNQILKSAKLIEKMDKRLKRMEKRMK